MSSPGRFPTAQTAMQRWFPAGVWLRKYDWKGSFSSDLIAAVSVAALLIPESMGLATVAGVPVEIGLYAAPLALIAYALLGGSRLVVVAVAGSVAAVSASIVGDLADGDQDQALALTAALAFTTGAVFLVAGLVRLGFITNFISKAVMGGFIIGLSIQIIIGQLGGLVGVEQTGDNAVEKLGSVLSDVEDWDWISVALGVGALALMIAIQRVVPKVPAALAAVIVGSVIVAAFDPDIVLVAEIPSGLPSIGLPSGIDASTWATLLLGGCVVALVGLSEGWGAAQAMAAANGDEIHSDQELRALGASNLGAGLLGGMVVTGSLGKSSAAESAGAKTQMSNIVLAALVLLTLLVLAPLFQWLPEAVLAAIVIDAMRGSAGPHRLVLLWRTDKIDFTLGCITMLVVLVVDLLPAMVVGIVLSLVYTIYRVSFPARVVLGRDPDTGDYVATSWLYGHRQGESNPDAAPVPGVIVFRFAAPLIFSNAEAFTDSGKAMLIDAGQQGRLPHTMVVDCEAVYRVDATGADAIRDLYRYTRRYDVNLVLARVHTGTHALLDVAGVVDELGESRFVSTVRGAVDAAVARAGEGTTTD